MTGSSHMAAVAPGSRAGRWLSTDEAARMLGITARALYRLIDTGEIPAYRMGRVLRIRASDVPGAPPAPRTEPRPPRRDTRRRPLQEATTGARIVRARIRRGWGQKRLAEAAGIDRAELSLIEHDRRPPRSDELADIAAALGTTAEELSAPAG